MLLGQRERLAEQSDGAARVASQHLPHQPDTEQRRRDAGPVVEPAPQVERPLEQCLLGVRVGLAHLTVHDGLERPPVHQPAELVQRRGFGRRARCGAQRVTEKLFRDGEVARAERRLGHRLDAAIQCHGSAAYRAGGGTPVPPPPDRSGHGAQGAAICHVLSSSHGAGLLYAVPPAPSVIQTSAL
ncbi:hypothetical protein GCM10009558_017410 [Virgisporangium aurantiacum]